MKMKLVWSLLASMVCLCAATNLAARSDTVDNGNYTSKDSEFYLSTEQLLFIRPGLELEILDVVIPADLQTEVTFKITDPEGLPLDRTGVTTPGPVSTSFILSFIPEGEEAYLAYTSRIQTSPITGDSAEQGSSDSGGSYTEISIGTYMYKFGTVLPADYDTDATTTLGIYARRDLREFDLDRYVTNELEHFVPSGVSDPMPRDIVTTETCNGRCHDPLAIHGGSRQAVGLCILCHNPFQDIDPDTGNSVDMPLMIHKIHMGANLTEGYVIIGYRQGVHDYSDVEYPAPINECGDCHTGGTPTDSFPLVATPNPVEACDMTGLGSTLLTWGDLDSFEIRMNAPDGQLYGKNAGAGSSQTSKWVKDGTVFFLIDSATGETIQELSVNATVLGCIGNAPGTVRGKAAVQHTNWMDHPTRKTCGSCHDYIDWETGEGHSEFSIAQPDDTNCYRCHEPTGAEYDRSVTGAHLELYKSAQLPGIVVKIMDIKDTNPGDTPTVTFSMGGKNAKIDPSSMDFFRLVIAGPNDDFSFLAEEFATGAVKAGDNWSYTFKTPLPADAKGSYSAGAEVFDMVPVELRDGETFVRHTAENSTFIFAVTDDSAVPRRMVVDDVKCENCHSNLALHGTIRHEPQYCATCHMPAATDVGELQEGNEEQSIHFKYMVHKIHRGEDLENGYVVAGHNQSIHDYSDVEYPGDLRNCDACHVEDSQQLPLPAGLLPTTTPQEWWDPMLPVASACLSCHDDDDSAAHAYSNTTFFGESCATCHGEGKTAAVDKVHAR